MKSFTREIRKIENFPPLKKSRCKQMLFLSVGKYATDVIAVTKKVMSILYSMTQSDVIGVSNLHCNNDRLPLFIDKINSIYSS